MGNSTSIVDSKSIDNFKVNLDKMCTEILSEKNMDKLLEDNFCTDIRLKIKSDIIGNTNDEVLHKLCSQVIYDIVKKQNKNLTPMWIGIGFVAGLTTSIGTIYGYEAIKKD